MDFKNNLNKKNYEKVEVFIEGAYNAQEDIDWTMFVNFAQSYPKKFNNIRKTDYGTFYDALNTSIEGQNYIIELKGRDENAINYADCFIEMNKYMNLKKEFNNNPNHPTPLYINFFGPNADIVYVWNLNDKKIKCSAYLNVPVKGHTELQDRIGLNWTDGTRFEKDMNGKYHIIQPKPNNHNYDYNHNHNYNYN